MPSTGGSQVPGGSIGGTDHGHFFRGTLSPQNFCHSIVDYLNAEWSKGHASILAR